MSFFNPPPLIIDINENEELRVTGDYDNFSFDYFIYAEAFKSWIKQDLKALESAHPKFCDALQYTIEKKLLKEGLYNEQYAGN